MGSIQNHSAPLEGTNSAAINRGLLGLFSKPGDKSAGGAESFSREVERAVERQGGQAAIEKRGSENSSARRTQRHSSFGGERTEGQASRAKGRDREREVPEELVPIERQVQASENRRAAQPRVEQGGRESQRTDAPATSSGGYTSMSEAQGPSTSAPGPQAGSDLSAPVAQGIGIAQPAAAGAPAAANATLQVRPNGGARPVDASQAFVDSAKAKGGVTGTKEAPATGSSPDPKLIEHAEKVLRQIRLHVRPGMKEITLNLNPVDLGRMSIDLRVQDKGLTAVVRVESAETLELLKHQAPELRAMLTQQGIETEQMEFKLAFDGSGFSQHGASKQSNRGKRQVAAPSAEQSIIPQPSRSSVSKLRGDGGIDTLA